MDHKEEVEELQEEIKSHNIRMKEMEYTIMKLQGEVQIVNDELVKTAENCAKMSEVILSMVGGKV